ncbi:AraC family transcriptional regulator [Umezawaea endophytica]|uniref:AraC family transcriptional regulator n=1 Tax=Umezawaea endophytica TaxID=1654476 RepID=A0A9X2VUM2_9PSEU|nr:AraC family transcriptional regulator [Umezawaea endophytica]MCS7482951.1 AraC family transcriptional regulator [Umezawaea endophytica]
MRALAVGATDDHVSDVLDLVRTTALTSSGFVARGTWVARSATPAPLTLLVVANGSARLTTDGVDHPARLETGDVAVLADRSRWEVRGGDDDEVPLEIPSTRVPLARGLFETGGGADVVVESRVDLNAVGRELLLHVLPPLGHVRASATAATRLRCSLDRLLAETRTERIGSAFAIRQETQLMVLDVLRAYVERIELPSGWLRLLTDERLRPAVKLLHTRPGERWTVDGLARTAAMSRTSFAGHFRSIAGVPPLTYLKKWRMLLAQRALCDSDVLIGPLGARLGYASESAFSTAFKQHAGESPLAYRLRRR